MTRTAGIFFTVISGLFLPFLFPLSVFSQTSSGDCLVVNDMVMRCTVNGQAMDYTKTDKDCKIGFTDDCKGYGGDGKCIQGCPDCEEGEGLCFLDSKAFQIYNEQKTLPVVGVASDLELFKPKININVPSLNLSDVQQNVDEEGYLHLPWVGEYLAGIYNFGLAVASIVGVVMIIVQGAKVVVSAGGSGKSEAYKKVTKIAIGLSILWISYALLYTINPDLVKFKALKIQYIDPIEVDEIEINEDNTWDDTTVFSGNIVPVTFSDNFTHAANTGPDGTLTDAQIAGLADAATLPDGSKLDRCFLWAGVRKESRSVQRVGIDENVAKTTDRKGRPAKIAARRQFIMSGVKYSGKTFDTKDLWGPDTSDCSSKLNPYPKDKLVKLPDPNVNYTHCHNDARTPDGYKIMNDAPGTGDFTKNPKKNEPPDYGYDWRFSKGLGLRQITINPAKRPIKVKGPNGDEWAIQFGEHFYTVTDLLNIEGSTRALMDWHLQKFKRKDCQTAHANRDLKAMWFCMGLGEASVDRAIEMYNKCPFPKFYH